MFIHIEIDSDIPIYKQLANGLIEGIANGSLQLGDSLPSVRSLAADLGVNMHTVNKAYHELERKEIIRIIPKSGAVVNTALPNDQANVRLESAMRPIIAEALAAGLREKEIFAHITKLITKIKEERQ